MYRPASSTVPAPFDRQQCTTSDLLEFSDDSLYFVKIFAIWHETVCRRTISKQKIYSNARSLFFRRKRKFIIIISDDSQKLQCVFIFVMRIRVTHTWQAQQDVDNAWFYYKTNSTSRPLSDGFWNYSCARRFPQTISPRYNTCCSYWWSCTSHDTTCSRPRIATQRHHP